MTDRLTEEQLHDIEQEANIVKTTGSTFASQEWASESLALIREIRALQRDLASCQEELGDLRTFKREEEWKRHQ